MSRRRKLIAVGLLIAGLAGGTSAAIAADPVEIGTRRLEVKTPDGEGLLALFLSANWDKPQPETRRALVIFHGNGRNARGYFNTGKKAREIAGEPTAIVIAPHFVTRGDLNQAGPEDADEILRWTRDSWKGGLPARGPAPISSYDAIDAILARLADRKMFPALEKVVLAGHSAGGQIVHRYAIVGKGLARMAEAGIAVRTVVANPSSYAYFTPDRPYSTAGCRGFNTWKYGMNGRPPYAQAGTPEALEAAYLARDVYYLMGTEDDDPAGEDIDTSCAAQAQGPSRYKRGESFFDYLRGRHPDLKHRFVPIKGVGHSAGKMFRSHCGVATLFDRPGCEGVGQ